MCAGPTVRPTAVEALCHPYYEPFLAKILPEKVEVVALRQERCALEMHMGVLRCTRFVHVGTCSCRWRHCFASLRAALRNERGFVALHCRGVAYHARQQPRRSEVGLAAAQPVDGAV